MQPENKKGNGSFAVRAASCDHSALESKRQRATIGSTLTYTYKAVHADVRLNYEKYFDYKEGAYSPDRFVAELVVRF